MVSASKRLLTCLAAVSATVSSSAGELKVKVYDGPSSCPDSEKVQPGSYVSIHYTGTIDKSSATGTPGKKFDSSRVRSKPFDVTIGVGEVIAGWDEGIVGLCVGAKANLVIPPELGYGDAGAGKDIPGGATLHFDVEIIAINEDGPKRPDMYTDNLFAQIDTDGDGKLTKEEVQEYFYSIHQDVAPEELWEHEDKNRDGVISWEFSGPKGANPMGDEF